MFLKVRVQVTSLSAGAKVEGPQDQLDEMAAQIESQLDDKPKFIREPGRVYVPLGDSRIDQAFRIVLERCKHDN